jgi:hypothetical protein
MLLLSELPYLLNYLVLRLSFDVSFPQYQTIIAYGVVGHDATQFILVPVVDLLGMPVRAEYFDDLLLTIDIYEVGYTTSQNDPQSAIAIKLVFREMFTQYSINVQFELVRFELSGIHLR